MASDRKEKLTIKVTLGPCRMSFPHLFTARETDNGDRYEADFLFPPDWVKRPDFKKFEDALYEVCEEAFGPEKSWVRNRTSRYADEVIRDATEKEYTGYKKGWLFVKAGSRDPVGIVDAAREKVDNPREVYGGRWCRISVTVSAYDNKSKGVGVYLNSVQVLDHDEPFGGRGDARDDFEDWDGPALSEDDRGTGRGNARPRDDDERGGRRGEREDSRDGRRGAGRADDDERPRRGRREDPPEDDAPRARGRRDEPEDERPSRSRRGDADEPRSGDRDGGSRRSARGRDADDDEADERPSRRGGGRAARDDEWN